MRYAATYKPEFRPPVPVHQRKSGINECVTRYVVNYEQAVEPFLKAARLSDTERATLMGGACAKAYGWSPKNA